MNKILFMIDGYSLINRMYYALPPLMNKKGMYTNAIYGMANLIYKVLDTYKPTHFCTAFDVKAPTFRHEEFAQYKGTRKKMPSELLSQVQPIKEMMEAFGLMHAELSGFEADDILGTLSRLAEEDGFLVYILTGDKDALQLASTKTKILFTKKGTSEMDIYDDQAVVERYGLSPVQFIDLKGLMGDSSDNIPGIPGIGEKTGIKLLQEYGSLDNLLLHAHELKGALRQKVEDGSQSALLSRSLATILRNIPLDINIEEDLKYTGSDNNKLNALFSEYEFSSLMNRLRSTSEPLQKMASIQPAYSLPTREDFSSEDPILLKCRLRPGHCVDQRIQTLYLLQRDKFYAIEGMQVEGLKVLLESSGFHFWGHGLKEDYVALKSYGIDLQGLDFDTKIAAYLLDSNRSEYSLENLTVARGLPGIASLEEGKRGAKSTKEEMQEPLCQEEKYFHYLDAVRKIVPLLQQDLESCSMQSLFADVEMKLIPVLGDMEYIGIKGDKKILLQLKKEFQKQLKELEENIYHLAGRSFNLNSPKQLGEILFDELKLPIIKKTKTGYSTNIEVLEALQESHPIIYPIMQYRTVSKLNSTYVEGLLPLIHPSTGRLHSNFHQTITATGRLSSTDPNMQNIPVRMEQGRELRKVFVAKEGCVLVDADYSQIELRILAHLAQDEAMLQSFEAKEDIHTRTASEVFGVDLSSVTKQMRSAAKAVNFGIVYGISDFGLSNNLGISVIDAKTYITAYLEKYPAIQTYMDEVVEEAKANGYSTTILGRRRYIPEIAASNRMVQNLGKRLAMNTPIQGSAADIIKLAMIHIWMYLKNVLPEAQLILQVHDELIVECPVEKAQEVEKIMKTLMEEAVSLSVKLSVDAKSGHSWYDTK